MRNEMAQAESAPFQTGRWNASPAERLADGIVHLIGIVCAISAGSILLAMAFTRTASGEYLALVLYVVALLAVLSVSFVYNMWPQTPVKWVLRRVDHSMIYVLIAASYTPFLVQLPERTEALPVLAFVWLVTVAGIALKIFMPGRLDRVAIAIYLLAGWSGVLLVRPLIETLPQTTVVLIVAGGLVYTFGVIFYVWRSLRFQTALWHVFVVVGAGLHCAAVMDSMVISRI